MQNEEHYQGRLASIEEELSGKKSSMEELQEEKSDLRAQLKEIRGTLKEKEEKLQDARENIEICTQAVEEGKNEIIEILNSRANTKGKAQRFDAMMEQADIRKAEISQRVLRLKSEEEEQQTILKKAQAQYDSITELIRSMNEECERLNQDVCSAFRMN